MFGVLVNFYINMDTAMTTEQRYPKIKFTLQDDESQKSGIPEKASSSSSSSSSSTHANFQEGIANHQHSAREEGSSSKHLKGTSKITFFGNKQYYNLKSDNGRENFINDLLQQVDKKSNNVIAILKTQTPLSLHFIFEDLIKSNKAADSNSYKRLISLVKTTIAEQTPTQVNLEDVLKEGEAPQGGMLLGSDEYKKILPIIEQDTAKGKAKFNKGKSIPSKYSVALDKQGDRYVIYNNGKGPDSGKDTAILGEGGFGKVKLAQRLRDGKWVAYKTQEEMVNTRLEIWDEEHKHAKQAELEISNIRRVMPYEKTWKNPSFDCWHKDIAFQELAGGVKGQSLDSPDLKKEFQENYSTRELLIVALECLRALKYCHDRNIVHRDVNPNNMIRNPENGKIKLVDFGSAATSGERPKNMRFTVGFFPPEHFRNKESKKSYDIYSMGRTIKKVLLDGEVDKKPLFTNLNILLLKMTNKSPDKRPTVDKCIEEVQNMITREEEQQKDKGTSNPQEKKNFADRVRGAFSR